MAVTVGPTSGSLADNKSIQRLCSFTLITFVILCVSCVSIDAGWQDDIQPKRIVTLGEEHILRFHGNHSHTDHFKLLETNGDFVLVGARNIIYNISLKDMTENRGQKIEWQPTSSTREMCLVKGKTEDDCQNYIRVLARLNDQEMLVCGTNAYNPLCRRYNIQSDGSVSVRKESTGKGLCPYDPNHNSTAVVTGGELYAGTVSDFSGLDPLIYKEPLRTEQYDLKHLNAPSFVSSLAHGDFVYFFFRETAVEYINCGKTVYSRVARVCKKDKGGPHRWSSRWTSFLKARLNCSVPGDFPFYFNEIQSTSDVIEGTYGHRTESVIYGVFTTPANSIYGSAVCAFRLQDLTDSFDGAFKEQATLNSNWLPVAANEVPEPRPGQCVNDSRSLPEVTLNFIKSHSLMDEAVPPFYGVPLLAHTSLKYKFTNIAVDPQVRAADGKTYDVLIIGTDKGKIIRAINAESYDSVSRVKPVVLEEIQVLESHAPIKNMKVVRSSSTDGPRLIVVSDDEIQSIPLQRCNTKSITTCSECVALQDPYCAWNPSTAQCVPVGSISPNSVSSLIQSVMTGYSDQCPDNVINDSKERIVTTNPPFVSEQPTCAPCMCPCSEEGSSISSTAPTPSSTSALSTDPPTSFSTTPLTTPTPSAVTTQSSSLGDLEMETNAIVEQENVINRNLVQYLDVAAGNQSDEVNSIHAQSPKVGASLTAPAAVYSAETFTVAVVVSCFSALIVGFVSGLFFSRRCRLGDLSGGFNGAPYLEQRRLSRLNETMAANEPSKMNNFVDNQTIKLANEKNANSTLDLKPTQKVKKTYV